MNAKKLLLVVAFVVAAVDGFAGGSFRIVNARAEPVFVYVFWTSDESGYFLDAHTSLVIPCDMGLSEVLFGRHWGSNEFGDWGDGAGIDSMTGDYEPLFIVLPDSSSDADFGNVKTTFSTRWARDKGSQTNTHRLNWWAFGVGLAFGIGLWVWRLTHQTFNEVV